MCGVAGLLDGKDVAPSHVKWYMMPWCFNQMHLARWCHFFALQNTDVVELFKHAHQTEVYSYILR